MKVLSTKLLASASVMALASGAHAEDSLPRDWTGFYGGAVGAVGMHSGATPGSAYYSYIGYYDRELSSWGGAIGITGGVNFQDGNLVYGIEGDLSWSSMSSGDRLTGSSIDSLMETEWNALATLRARAGLAIDDTVAYVTGGLAFVDLDQYLACSPDCAAFSSYYEFHNSGWETGIAVGAGVEHALNDNLSVKFEYLYVGLPSDTVTHSGLPDFDGANFRSSAHLLRAGLNYRFGGGTSSEYGLSSAIDQSMVPHDWSGFYAGIVAGGGIFNGYTPAYYYGGYYDIELSDWGGTIGLSAGANVQDGSLVYGIEGDISWANLGHDSYEADYSGGYYESTSDWNALATIRARAGVAVDKTLVYVTGGLALVDVDQWHCYNAGECGAGSYDGYYDFHNSGWQTGIAAGVGLEHAFTDNLSLKLEYLYVGLPTESVKSEYIATDTSGMGSNFKSEAHLVRAGLNYSFGAGGSNSQSGAMESHDWRGIYGGVVAGAGLFTGQTPGYYSGTYYDIEISDWGAAAGLTLGTNAQSGHFVYGLEADISLTNLGHDSYETYYDGDYYESESEWNSLITVRARAGISSYDTMFYATGGLALVDVEQWHCYNAGECGAGSYDGYYDFHNSGWQAGIAAGAGVEHAISDNMSLKFEYLYVGLPTKEVNSEHTSNSSDDAFSFKSEAHIIRAGLNIKF